MKRIRVKTQSPYDVAVGENILPLIGVELKLLGFGGRALIVTDSGVPAEYVDEVESSLKREGIAVFRFVFSQGEQSKNQTTLFDILSAMADHHLTRGDFAVAVGGGVVGDITGFAAACYMRGIRYVQVPTTMLAAIDSSVGGKTAIDLPQGKNLVGAFHQPGLVWCDVKTLKTLSADNVRCGIGEAVKYGLLAGGSLWHSVKGGSYGSELFFEGTDLEQLIADCVEIKADVVCKDEHEGGLRKILNLGHTVGHAIEKLGGYTIPHGVCVAKGLVKLFRCLGENPALVREVEHAFDNYGIDHTCPYSADELIEAMRMDKKSGGEYISVVTVSEAGKPRIESFSFKELGEILCRA